MKEVTIETQRVETHVLYEAVDGTRFCSKEECEKYENSAKGVLRGKLKALIVNEPVNAWDLMGGYDDYQVIGVRINTAADRDTVIQNFYLDNPWSLKDSNEERRKKFLELVDDALNNGDLLLLGLNTESELYIIDTRQHIIDRLNALDKRDTRE